MYAHMTMYSLGEFSKKVRKSVSTLQRWDRSGVLPAARTITNRRYYTDEHLRKALGLSDESVNILARMIADDSCP